MPEQSPQARPQRVVAVGDLNGSFAALVESLRGTETVNRSGRWSAGTTHLIQVGDIFNRGDGARESFELLVRLRTQARAVGGEVTILLGNHEVMTTLGNEAYCTVGEYLSFASRTERAAWPQRIHRAYLRLFRDGGDGGPIQPIVPRLEMWMAANAPGRERMRRALSPRGRLGKLIRKLPVAARLGDVVFVHAGLTPLWARYGVDGLNAAAEQAWHGAPAFWGQVSGRSILRAPNGPLLTRKLAHGRGSETESMLTQVLAALGARRLVIGHTQTKNAPGGKPGRILTRFRNRLVYIDVGMRGNDGGPRAALVIEGGVGREWIPDGGRELWRDGS